MSGTLELTRTFAALGDPTRLAILARLAEGEATVGDLAQPFKLSQQAISKHLKVLEGAGLVSRRVAAQSRPCRLEVERLDSAVGWIDQQRRIWVERHDRLAAHLEELTAAGDDEVRR
jgi:DNA-binding transcriptional ArsR family regulator